MDVSTLQVAVESLQADNDMILEARVSEFETPLVESDEDTLMAALFSSSKIPTSQPRACQEAQGSSGG